MSDRLPLVLDVDTGIDDALAILYAVTSPAVELVAVSCVAGNVDGRQVAENTKGLLELVGRADVEVALGAEAPLAKPLRTTPETHGPRGIGHARLPAPVGGFADEPAAALLVRLAHERPGELLLVTLGPMTNLALALRAEPRLPALLRGWTFMGGAFAVPGNTTPTSEWNVHVDPEAAAEALAAWAAAREADASIPLALGMGLDVTERARLLPDRVGAIAAARGAAPAEVAAIVEEMVATGAAASDRVLRFVVDSLRFYFEFHRAYDGFYGAFVHDPFAVAATLDPSLVRTEPLFVDVETGSGPAHAMTVADRRGLLGRVPNVAVAVDGDGDLFLDGLVDGLASIAAPARATGRTS